MYEEVRKYLVIYEEAVRHKVMKFLIYEENYIFLFIIVQPTMTDVSMNAVYCTYP